MCLRSTVSHSHIILRTSLQPRQQLFNLSELWRSLLSSAADGERIHLSVCVWIYVCIWVCFLVNKGHFLEIFLILHSYSLLHRDHRCCLHVLDTDRLLMSTVLLMYIFCYCQSDFPPFLSSLNQPFTLSVCVSGGHGYMQRRGEPSGKRSRANERIRMGRKKVKRKLNRTG